MTLDDFTPAQEHSSWTDEMEFTSSVFEISSIPIRYFLTNVKLSALEQSFKLVEDIPGSANWGYNAIFQRDIDDERVEKELLEKYLLNPHKFKFFNPLTIALLPFDFETNAVLDAYQDAVARDEDGYLKEIIGGIEIQQLKGTTVGKIRWDRDRIFGVAIDGQHRLSALMKYATSPNKPQGIDPGRVRIPVVLLVFDVEKGNILKQIREIFVDINKNAEPVRGARRILLDDRDVQAVFARDLIKDEDNPNGLRYEVVDWKRETARPESPHQLTTIVVLYEIIKLLFGNTVKLETELDINTELERKGFLPISTSDSIDDLSDKQIEVALERFRSKHKKFILWLFKNLPPYQEIISELSNYIDNETDASQAFREYLFKPANKRDRFKDELRGREFDIGKVIDEPMEKLQEAKNKQKTSELLFFAIGQRALFSWFHHLVKIYNLRGFQNLEEIAKEYCEDLTCLINNGFFAKAMEIETAEIDSFSIWQGVCLRGDKVNSSKAAASRLGALVVLSVAAIRFDGTEIKDLVQSEVNLKSPFRKVRDEYIKQWLPILEEKWTSEPPEIDYDDEEEYIEIPPDEQLYKAAEEYAEKTIHEILEKVRGWSQSV